MQQLCNKLSDHTFKIEKGKHKQQQKKSEKTRDFIFFPLFPCRSPAIDARTISCRLPLETNNDKSVGLIYLSCAKNGQRYYSQTMKECVCVLYLYREINRGRRRGVGNKEEIEKRQEGK